MGSGPELQMQQIACQELLTKEGVCFGWLRGKTVLHKWGDSVDQKINKPGFAQQITSMISWRRLYVVVNDGYFLIYKSETSKKPDKVIDLCGFQGVEKEEYLKIKDVPWPFKVSSDVNNKVMYYGAMSEPELKKWIEAVTKGIDDAKQSGRQPVIYEKKETIPKPAKNKAEKPLPRTPSIHPTEEDDDDDLQDDYDYIPDPIEEMQQNSKQTPRSPLPPLPAVSSSSSGRGGEVEYEMHSPNLLHQKVESKPSVRPRKDLAVPPPPVENIEIVKANLKKAPPQVPAGDKPQPPVALKKPPAVPKPLGGKPTPPVKNDIQSNLAKKPVPPMPAAANSQPAVEDDVEYEMTDDRIVRDATWTGAQEESTELMKSIKEDGVFMLRESTSGNGDQTLQVVSDNCVRKYKIVKEGRQFRIAGGNEFDSMADLLNFYLNNTIPNHTTKLTKPYSKV